MLFISDWYFPKASSQNFFREARVDKSVIRIKSAHKWPAPIVIDTSLPTITVFGKRGLRVPAAM
jgi:hypothetical protein